MPLRRERAFVLSAIPLKEKDRIVTLLTEESGTKRAVARGARRLQSAFAGALEPMSEADVLMFEQEGRELLRIDSVNLVRSSFSLATDLARALLLSAMAETLTTFVSDSDPSERFFRLARHAMDALFAGDDVRKVSVYFDLWILKLSGVLAPASKCAACGRPLAGRAIYLDESVPGFVGKECAPAGALRLAADAAAALSEFELRRVGDVSASPRVLSEISEVTARLRRHFLGHELKSHRVLEEVW